MAQQSLACPQCGQLDAVQKVSAIVASQTSTGRYSGPSVAMGGTFGGSGGTTVMGGYTTLSGQSQSVLAQMVAAAAPEKPRDTRVRVASARMLVMFLVVVGIIPLLAGWVVGNRVPELSTSLIVIGSILGVGCIIAIIRLPSTRERFERETLAWQAASNRWNTAMDRWNRLFYCHRCDGVFIPGGRLVPTTQIRSLLYD